MTNTLHENGHWVQDRNDLDNLVESSSADRNPTMDRNNHHDSSIETPNQAQETNDTNVNEQIEDEDDSAVSLNESEQEAAHRLNVPYTYTGHLGTTSPQVLRHIEEAIDQVVKNFQISKSDQMAGTSLLASNCSLNRPSSSHSNNSNIIKATKPNKRDRRKKTNHLSFDFDRPFELDASSSTQTNKRTDVKKRDQFSGPFIRVEKKKNQTNFVVVNSSSKLEDKDNKFSNKLNYGSIAKSKSSNQILFKQNDNTWICVFCKRQPHYRQLGDLFGPHELASVDNNLDNNLNGTLNDPPTTSHHNNSNMKNEVWFHEDCVIWSNGIYLAGNRVRNIDEVVLECNDITCCECKLKGANLGCVQKGCNQTFHYICAKECGCELDEENFSMFCQNHKKIQ